MNTSRDNRNIRLAVKVTPNAGRNEITGFREDVLQVRIAAPPDKGKANQELTDFLAEKLGVKKSAITIIRGMTSRHKVLTISGLSQAEMMLRLLI
ncbi:MAG: DUF167 domain-containing protein [Dehalococcoidales bacterium]|jgi:uncharacterized protein (TIGR00251 family)